jgi:hypothetical protein
MMFLSQAALGTDDKIVIQELRRAYLTFLGVIISSDAIAIMRIERITILLSPLCSLTYLFPLDNLSKLELIATSLSGFAMFTEDMLVRNLIF